MELRFEPQRLLEHATTGELVLLAELATGERTLELTDLPRLVALLARFVWDEETEAYLDEAAARRWLEAQPFAQLLALLGRSAEEAAVPNSNGGVSLSP